MISALLLLVSVLETGPANLEGGWLARGEAGQCRVVLMSPAVSPPESRMVPGSVSGLAAVEPGCGLGLRDAGLWTWSREDGRLALTSHGGEPLWTGHRESEGHWAGADADGSLIGLIKG